MGRVVSTRHCEILEICDVLEHKPEVYVETGTYYGDTTINLINDFRAMYTIELSNQLYLKSMNRFEGTNVTCLQGDSTKLLKPLALSIAEPVLWFLDAHWFKARRGANQCVAGKDNPVPLLQEIDTILSLRSHNDVIAVDDVRSFGVKHRGQPKAWIEITTENLIKKVNPIKTHTTRNVFGMLTREC